MTNYDYVEATLDLFEDSLSAGAPFTTAAALAARIGYSPHHLGRLFHSLCGESLGRYILRRRLAAAAVAIRSKELSPSEASLRYGWEDYSAFSRGVRREFGVSPARLPLLDGGSLTLAARARLRVPGESITPLDDPRLCSVRPIHVTGVVFYMTMNEKSFHTPWRIFMKNRHLIRGVIGDDSRQFSSWDENADPAEDGLWIHCALQTNPREEQDMRFFSRSIPPMEVLDFVHSGPIETIHNTYRRIFEEYLPASTLQLAGNMEYQHYGSDGSIHICLPVMERAGDPEACRQQISL